MVFELKRKMAKRNYNNAFDDISTKTGDLKKDVVKKHTLDSDEEDDVDDDNVLNADDIEGEEEGVDRQDGEQKMTAFNMKEEMEEGHFDRDGHFIWNNEKEIKDSWLDNIDWHQIKTNAQMDNKYDVYEKGLGAESDSEEEEDAFDEIDTYKNMLEYMKPSESVNKALARLGGADMKLSSVERLKRKKAGTLVVSKDVSNLTELANKVLTKLGNMDVYQETYEQIMEKIDKNKKPVAKDSELDMYADDFDEKEKAKIDSSSVSKNNEPEGGNDNDEKLMWEFKWKMEEDKTEGPYTTREMVQFSRDNYFKSGVFARKYGSNSSFYNSNRIDFELYE